MSKFKIALLCFYILCNIVHGYSQYYAQVTHTQGTQNVDGIMVTVTPSNYAAYNDTYCSSTIPFAIGNDPWGGIGSFTFDFFPAVSSLSLNFSGLSNVAGHVEEIKLFKNGVHLPILESGAKNECDLLGIITSQGNIRGCQGCPLSGWNGTNVYGSISKIMILDTVFMGNPGGALFSLYFVSNPLTENEIENKFTRCVFSPNPFSIESTLSLPRLNDLSLIVYRNDGKQIKNTDASNLNKIIVSKDDYPTGIYYYQLRSNSDILTSGKLISN